MEQNIIRDYNKSQGTTHPTDLSYQIIRNYNLRYITIENSAERPIGIAITTYSSGPVPPILHILVGGEIKHLGINSPGDPTQFIWILDPVNGKKLSNPTAIRTTSNQLVLRDGVNIWFVDFFKRPSYYAAK